MARLERVRLIPHHRLELWYSFQEFTLPVISESNVQADARDLRRQPLRLVQHFQGLRPLLSPHVDDAEVGIGTC